MVDRVEPVGPMSQPQLAQPKGVLRRARAAWPFDVADILALIGLLLLAFGCFLVHPALAFIVTGVLVMGYAILASLPARPGGQS